MGKVLNEQFIDLQDLKYLNNTVLQNALSFQLDAVYTEGQKQEKFYSQQIRPIVKNFIEGDNGCVVLFGPTEGGKSHTLKGKTGSERGVLPRAVEDIFQIVRNSEDIPDMGIDIVPKQDYGGRRDVDRLFLKV